MGSCPIGGYYKCKIWSIVPSELVKVYWVCWDWLISATMAIWNLQPSYWMVRTDDQCALMIIMYRSWEVMVETDIFAYLVLLDIILWPPISFLWESIYCRSIAVVVFFHPFQHIHQKITQVGFIYLQVSKIKLLIYVKMTGDYSPCDQSAQAISIRPKSVFDEKVRKWNHWRRLVPKKGKMIIAISGCS